MADRNRIVTDNMQFGYREVIESIKQYGSVTAPRDQPTLELSDFQLLLLDPSMSVPWGIGRQLNLTIASAELVQLIGGYSDLQQLTSIAPRFADFADGGRLRGAYGPRLHDQLPLVLRRLATDRDTRQAVATIWRPSDLAQPSRDVPCTVSLSWTIRDGVLDMHTHMRSNDAWLGMCYDVPIFTALQRSLAHVLNIGTGVYVHNVTSLHIYERDLDATKRLHNLPASHDPDEFVDKVPPLITYDDPLGPEGMTRVDPVTELPPLRWLMTRELARRIGMGRVETTDINEWNAVHIHRLFHHQPRPRMICRWCDYVYDPGETTPLNPCIECTVMENVQ